MTSPSHNTNSGLERNTELSSSVFEVSEERGCFSEPTLKSISKLSDVLKRIDSRMRREGFSMQYGKIVKNEND